jgi:probable phosphoglycerate mutase
LDDVGRTQAERVAEVLAPMAPALVLSSDLVRASDTAEALGAATGLVPVLDARLRELSLGSWEGLTSSQARESHPEEHATWRSGADVRRGGGETRREAGERAAACVREHLPSVAPGGLIVVVTHGGTARAALGVLLDLPDACWVRLVALGNACWSVLVEADLGWRLEQHNMGFTVGDLSIEPGR